MNRSQIIDALIKAAGALLLVKGISLLATVPFSYEAALISETASPLLHVSSSLTYSIFHMVIGFLMIFRTELLTSKLASTPDDSSLSSVAITYSQAIQLLGIFFTVSGCADFASKIEWIFGAESTTVTRASLWYPPLVEIIFGLILFTQSNKLASLFQRK